MRCKTAIGIFVLVFSLSLQADAARRESADYGVQSDSANEGGAKSSSSSYIIRQGSAGQGGVGQSDSSGYGAGQGYIFTTNTKPLSPESLAQYKADGTTSIPWPAGWTNTTTEVMKFDIEDPDPGDVLTTQIEVVLSGEAFRDAVSFEGDTYDYSGTTVNASVSAAGMEHAQSYVWQARVKDLENYYSDWVPIGGDPDYSVDLVPPASSELLVASATPEPDPTEVYLTWEAGSDALSGVAGYNLYRSTTPETGYIKIQSLVTALSTTDSTVSSGTDYYYVLATVDEAGGESEFSNQASAPYIDLTREAQVVAPVSGGYSGNADDAVPGSTIKYVVSYTNDGFALATSVEVVDKIPPHTEFKMGTATGEAVTAVQYSDDNGSTFTYTPSGAYVDPAVTNIKWYCEDISSGDTKTVEFSVVIR